MEPRTRQKLALVVDRYGAEEVGEAGRRTRCIAAAAADRGHDVTVVTTCARTPGGWQNEHAEGETFLDGVRVLRFELEPERRGVAAWLRSAGRERLPRWLAGVVPDERPMSSGLLQYLTRTRDSFDATVFSGAWGAMVRDGVAAVRTAVLAPPPIDAVSLGGADCAQLLMRAAAVLYAFPEQERLVQSRAACVPRHDAVVIGACSEPISPKATSGFAPPQPVTGPFVLSVGGHGAASERLVRAFRAFRDAHASTPFEDDERGTFEGRDLRLVLAGDFAHPFAPEDRVLGIGPVDDAVRISLVRSALAVVHVDPAAQFPVQLIEAWGAGKPVVVMDANPLLRASAGRLALRHACDAFTFPSCLAALLATRAPRSTLSQQVRAHAQRVFSPAQVVHALEESLASLGASRAARA